MDNCPLSGQIGRATSGDDPEAQLGFWELGWSSLRAPFGLAKATSFTAGLFGLVWRGAKAPLLFGGRAGRHRPTFRLD